MRIRAGIGSDPESKEVCRGLIGSASECEDRTLARLGWPLQKRHARKLVVSAVCPAEVAVADGSMFIHSISISKDWW